MIRAEPFRDLPPPVVADLRDEDEDRALWWLVKDHIISMSRIKFAVWEDDKPLLAVGAMQMNFLVPEAEVWFLATKHLHIGHLPEMRRLFWEYMDTYQGVRLIARAKSKYSRDVKFIRFFGGTLLDANDKEQLYKVSR